MKCPECDGEMEEIEECHWKCKNCASEIDELDEEKVRR